jgi:serine/threonine-protein kinase
MSSDADPDRRPRRAPEAGPAPTRRRRRKRRPTAGAARPIPPKPPKGAAPSKPVKPVKPARPAKAVKPARPAKAVKPARAVKPKAAAPAKPDRSQAKSETARADTAAQPVQPAKPVKPARPAKPVKPARPAKAVKPARPAKAVKPARAVKPKAAAPAKPDRSQAKSETARADTAAQPVQPATPAKAVKPTAAAPAGPAPAGAEAGGPPADPLIGQTIGRCRIEALVGVGRTARVYRAHYEALDDTVAVKILRRDVAENPLLVQRFDSEARAIAKVDNEHVLKIYDVGTTDDDLHYMVVELLEGEEILDLIQREGQVDVMDSLRIVRQAASGLAAAHAHGLVHRDIKPQNLFLLEDGTVKVVDFGLAARIDDTSERVGTPHYMAPEVCENGAAVPGSDVYGLGIVLYHLLTGQPPYAGKDIKAILQAHITGEALHPERLRPGLPKEAIEFVRQLTKRDALMRPTAVQVVAELDRIGGEQLRHKDTLRRRRARSSRARSAVARRERRAKAAPALLAIFGGVGLVALVLFFVLGSGNDKPAAPGSGGAGTPATETADVPAVTPPTSPEESERERKEREAREARAAQAQREKEAQAALERAEQWARENWHVPSDTEAVLDHYRTVREMYKQTKAAAEAWRRIDLIKRKKMHPNPDMKWTPADEVAAAKARWAKDRPEAQKEIAAFDYEAAAARVPKEAPTERGSFAREVDFWRMYTDHLVAFKQALVREASKLAASDRTITTPEGEGQVVQLDGASFEVRVGGKTRTWTWAQIGAKPIATFALDLFSGHVDLMLLQLAFTYAYDLNDAFWDAQTELSVDEGSRSVAREIKLYTDAFKARH